MAKKRFMRIRESYGKSGMDLNLDLNQCQELASMYGKICAIADFDGSIEGRMEMAEEVMQRMSKFLYLFEPFYVPTIDELWEIEDESVKIASKENYRAAE